MCLKRIKGVWKEHWIPISILALLIIIFCYPYFSSDTMPVRAGPGLGLPAGDAHYNAANAMIAQNAAREFDLPLWSPYTMSGTPFYAKPQVPFFYITYPLYFLAPTPWAFLKWSLIIHLLIAGIAMYSLFWYMRKDKYASFIAALCYMFSGYITADLFGGHPNIVFKGNERGSH